MALLIPCVNTIEKISFHYNFISIFCEHHQNMEEDKNEKERQLFGISFYPEETGGKIAEYGHRRSSFAQKRIKDH